MPALPDLSRLPTLESIAYREPYTEEWLQAQRALGDPLADRVIAAMVEKGPLGRSTDLLGEVRRRAAEEGGVFQDYLRETGRVPEWVDFDRMVKGQRLIASAVALMGLTLLTGSLVGGYVFVKAAKVTALTGRLAMPGDISRRLVETSVLVLLMSRPREIRPGGRAHEILVRVRLLHAALRHWMRASGRWREEWDEPVNQEDLTITLSEFSYLNLRSLTRLGVSLTDEEVDSHFQLWRWAGHVLGIQEHILPRSFAHEVEQFLPMLKHQARPSEGAPEARRILDEVADKARWLPERLRREALYQITAHLVGEEMVVGLGIRPDPRHPAIGLARACGRLWTLVHRRVPGGEALLHALGQREIERFVARAERERPLAYGVKTHSREELRRALGRGSSLRPAQA